MKAAYLNKPFDITIGEAPMPEPGPDEVVLKNVYLGVCTSDVQIYHGLHAYARITVSGEPQIMGHEEAGIICKVGQNVRDWKPGDRVILQPQLFCGECYPCRTGHFNVCEHLNVIGIHVDGCACEYTAVPAWNLHALPDNVSFRQAALIEPIAVGFGVVRRINEVTDITGKTICVVGAGTIGNLVAQACKVMGSGKVMITDILPSKLDLALECGIDYAENTKDQTLAEAIGKCFGPDKADIIVDSAANPFVFQSIMEAARKASIVVLSGNYKEPVQLDVTQIQRREITVLGHMMYLREEFDKGLKAIADGRLKIEGLITQEWSLDQYAEAFRYLDDHPADVVKMVVKIGAE